MEQQAGGIRQRGPVLELGFGVRIRVWVRGLGAVLGWFAQLPAGPLQT